MTMSTLLKARGTLDTLLKSCEYLTPNTMKLNLAQLAQLMDLAIKEDEVNQNVVVNNNDRWEWADLKAATIVNSMNEYLLLWDMNSLTMAAHQTIDKCQVMIRTILLAGTQK